LVIAGPKVRPGSYQDVQQPDIPMTISALLGQPLPRSGQGRVLYEMLDTSEAEQAQGEVNLVAQQMAQAGAYLASIGAPGLPADLTGRLSGLEDQLQAKDWAGAKSAAVALREQIGQVVDQQREARINRSRWLAAAVALVGFVLLGLLYASNVRAWGWAPLLCSLAGAAAYYGFYLLRGHVFSASTLSSPGAPTSVVYTLVLGALLALLLPVGLLWLASRRPAASGRRSLARSTPALCAGVVGLLFAVTLCAWMANGKLGDWVFITPVASFLLLLGILQVAATALLAIPIMSVAGVVSWLRRRARA
jgi:hypothetical protein